MKEETRNLLRARLVSLRPLLLGDGSQERVDYFDELVEQTEFGLALESVSDFLLSSSAPHTVPKTVIAEIKELYTLMEMPCPSSLHALASSREPT
jgi:hypothetical protein